MGSEGYTDKSMETTAVVSTSGAEGTVMCDYRDDCIRWRREVRKALFVQYHKKGVGEISDNEVYEVIYNLRLVSPPPLRPDNERVGLARSSVFTEKDGPFSELFYERTDKTTLSNDPSAKRRRIRIFRYLPEDDVRAYTKHCERTADWAGIDDF